MSRLVLATASTEFEDRVRSALDDTNGGNVRYWRDGILRGDPSRTVKELVNGGADVVALGPGLPPETALELARALDLDCPEVSVVIVADPSPRLLQAALRAGARDVIAPDAPDHELRDAFQLALGTATQRRSVLDRRAEPHSASAKVVTVVCPKGGAGKTTVASNLAAGLSRIAPGKVALVDLDLQFGDVASALHLTPEHTMSDVAHAPQLDATTLKVLLTPHGSDLFVLCAPTAPVDADDVGTDDVERTLRLLMESFEYIVVDTASGLDGAALVALEASTDLVLLSAPDVPCVRGTRKLVDALRMIDTPMQRWHLVLNRADARTGLGMSDIEATIGLRVDVAIPDARAVPLALNQGTPIVEVDPRAAASKAILEIVERIAPDATSSRNGTASGTSSLFRRKQVAS